MKLKRFSKLTDLQRCIIALFLGIFVGIGGIALFKSFALFEEKASFDVIRGRIPPFKKKQKDLDLAILIDGESSTEIPEGRDYRVNVTCDDEAITGTWDYNTWEINVRGALTMGTICSVNFESIYNITVDGTSQKAFPDRGDYQVNMACQNAEEHNWDEANWKPVVSGIKNNTSCDVTFKSTNNVITKITLNGEVVDAYPEKGSVTGTTVTCTNDSTGEWDKENWKPIIKNVTSETTCEVAFFTTFYDAASVGDYVAYTPSKTRYDIANSLTGMDKYSETDSTLVAIKNAGKQTIKPSELNLWRVIKKNEDGTIEIVSEYV